MDVLVTGARGFIGLNLVQNLASKGLDVWAVDRSDQDEWVNAFLMEHQERIKHLVVDLSTPGALQDALPARELVFVVHAAVITATTEAVERRDAREIVDANVGGTIEALQAAVDFGASRFVYVSSPSAIGKTTTLEPIGEDVVPKPDSLYGITKYSSELIVERWGTLFDIETASVRIAQPYGPGERATGARVRTSPIWEWLRDARPGATLTTGPLGRSRDWTFIDDTTEGIARLALSDELPHRLYHLGTGVDVTVGEILTLLDQEFGGLSHDPNALAPHLNPNIIGPGRPPLNVRTFSDDFGWRPTTSIREGLRRYIAWWSEFEKMISM